MIWRPPRETTPRSTAAWPTSYFGSETDFGRMLIQNSTYYALGKNRGRKKICSRSFHPHRNRDSLREHVHAAAGRSLSAASARSAGMPSSGRALFLRGRKLASRLWIESGRTARSRDRISSGWNRAVHEQYRTPHSTADLALFPGQHQLRHLPRCRKRLYQRT